MNYIARAATQLSRKMDNECFLLRVAAMVWLDPILIVDLTQNDIVDQRKGQDDETAPVEP